MQLVETLFCLYGINVVTLHTKSVFKDETTKNYKEYH